MTETLQLLIEFQKAFQKLEIGEDGTTATLPITSQIELNVNPLKPVEKWAFVNTKTHVVYNSHNMTDQMKSTHDEIKSVWNSIIEQFGSPDNSVGVEEISEDGDIVADGGYEKLDKKTDNWSVPKPKNEKINYDDGLDPVTLPAPVGVGGIVRPAVTAAEALAAWREFQALKKAILEPTDYQEIEVFDKRTGTKKKSKFVKKSGWRKLAACFNLTIRTMSEVKEPTKNGGFLWTIRVVCVAPNGREMEGAAKCSSDEKTGQRIEHDVYTTAYTRAVNRAISDLIAAGEASAEEMVS